MHDPLRGPAAAARRGEPFLPRRERFSSGIDEFAEIRWRASKTCPPMPARGTRRLQVLKMRLPFEQRTGMVGSRHAVAPPVPGPSCWGRAEIAWHCWFSCREHPVGGVMHVLAPADKPADAARERRGF